MQQQYVRQYPMIVQLLHSGADPAEIPQLVGLSEVVWKRIQADPDFKAMREQAEEPFRAPMSGEEVLEKASSMTGQAFEALQAIIEDHKASPTARLAAAKQALEWREELVRKKQEVDSRIVYHLYIDQRATKRMQAMIDDFMSDEGKTWLAQMSQIMPNSTA